jgi:hypothetical protein
MKHFLFFAMLACGASALSAQTDCTNPYDGNGDGICDDVDTCVGELDECGVCNGPGPTEIVIEDITIPYDSVSEGKQSTKNEIE